MNHQPSSREGTMSKRSDGTVFSPKIRYNWGYHDALVHATMLGYVAEWRRGPRNTHFDKHYVEGYYAGMNAAKETTR